MDMAILASVAFYRQPSAPSRSSLAGQKHRVSMSVFVPQQLLKDYCQWIKTDV